MTENIRLNRSINNRRAKPKLDKSDWPHNDGKAPTVDENRAQTDRNAAAYEAESKKARKASK